jgi:hypothetical protein
MRGTQGAKSPGSRYRTAMVRCCPRCSGPPAVIESLTARLAGPSARFDLQARCSCSVSWSERDLSHAEALELVTTALAGNRWSGSTRVCHALLLELAGQVEEAYLEYEMALRCRDVFGRAHCHERRAAYELQRGWVRCALRSLRAARAQDRDEGGTQQERYLSGCEVLERALAANGVSFAPEAEDETDRAWRRACEHERPPGFGALDAQGRPLGDDVLEVERCVRARRWAEAVAAMRALEGARRVDAIGFASRGVDEMVEAGARDEARALQALVVAAHEVLASWSTSGAEGSARMADVERERRRLSTLEPGR